MTKKIQLPRVRAPNTTGALPEGVQQALAELSASAQLEGVVLLKTEGAFHPDRMPNSDADSLHLSVLRPEFRFSRGDNDDIIFCGSRLVAIVTAVGAHADRKNAVVEVMGEYLLRYTVPKGKEWPKEALLLFAGRNGVFNAWPFFRELVHSFGARMDMPSLVLPLHRMPLLPGANRTRAGNPAPALPATAAPALPAVGAEAGKPRRKKAGRKKA